MSGRQGDPSLRTVMQPVDSADATKSLSTRSNRRRSLMPHAVANRRQVVRKFLSANSASADSVMTFDRAYAVKGLTSDDSVRGPLSAEPYTLQLEANTNDETPADLARRANSTLAR